MILLSTFIKEILMAYENSPIIIDETPGIKTIVLVVNLTINLIAMDPTAHRQQEKLQKNL